MSVSSIRWGVIWIGIGLLFLAINLELLESLVFPRLFSLWPILLIAIGVEVMFRRTKLYFLALLSPILIAAAFIIAAYSRDEWGWNSDQFWRRWVWRAESRKISIAEVPADSTVEMLELDLNCGPSQVSLQPSSDMLFRATSEYYQRSPWLEHVLTNGVERIEFENRESTRLTIFGLNIAASKSQFQIADFLPLKASISALDDESEFDFSGLKLSALQLHIRSNRALIRLGELQDTVNVTISGDSDHLEITLPGQFGLAIMGDSLRLHRLLQSSDLVPRSDGYFSRAYNSDIRKIRVLLGADIKSLSIMRN